MTFPYPVAQVVNVLKVRDNIVEIRCTELLALHLRPDLYVGYVPKLLAQGILQRILMPNIIPERARDMYQELQTKK